MRAVMPSRSKSARSSAGGSNAFETIPSFRPRSRSASSSACVVDASSVVRLDGGVLGLDEACDLRLVGLDARIGEHPANEAHVPDLLERARGVEQRQVDLDESRRQLGARVMADRT